MWFGLQGSGLRFKGIRSIAQMIMFRVDGLHRKEERQRQISETAP